MFPTSASNTTSPYYFSDLYLNKNIKIMEHCAGIGSELNVIYNKQQLQKNK